MATPAEIERRREVAIEAAQAAAAVHMRYRGENLQRDIHGGDHADYATRVDFESQDAVKAVVARHFPDEIVIGEEDTALYDRVRDLTQSGVWFTDPLDGTADYVHGHPGFSAIVSYVERGEPLACSVYFPAQGELFSAGASLGASLNDAPIHVSGITQLSGAMLSTAFRGTAPERIAGFTQRIAKVAPHIEALRLPGAPGVMATAVACGRYDVFTMMGQALETPQADRPFFGQPWETAAFILLVREAGGAVAGLRGGPPDILGYNVFAASQSLIDQLAAVMAG